MRDAILTTVYRMIGAVDAREWDVAAGCFDEVVLVDYSCLFGVPAAEIRAVDLVGSWQQRLARIRTHHQLGNLLVSAAAEGVIASAHVVGRHFSTEDPDRYWDVYGRYELRLARRGEEWRITSLCFHSTGERGDRSLVTG